MVGRTSDACACIILPTNDVGYVISGYTNSSNGDVSGNHGNYDAWVVKIHPDNLRNANFGSNMITLYPNASSSVLNLKNSTNTLFDKVSIFDLTGKVILTKSNTNELNIEQLVSGIYSFMPIYILLILAVSL